MSEEDPSSPNALCPSCLQTTLASLNLQVDWPHTVPQALLAHISTLPSSGEEPPNSLISPSAQLAGLLKVAKNKEYSYMLYQETGIRIYQLYRHYDCVVDLH